MLLPAWRRRRRCGQVKSCSSALTDELHYIEREVGFRNKESMCQRPIVQQSGLRLSVASRWQLFSLQGVHAWCKSRDHFTEKILQGEKKKE